MSSARLMLRRTITSFLSPRFLIGSIGSICVLVVLVVFHPRARAVEGTLNVTATTASYSGTMTQAGNQPIRTAFGPLRLDYKSGPNAWTTGLLMREGDGNVTVGAGITSADFNSASKLRVLGVVESTTGGFKFPDGTTQTSAASAAVGGGWTDGGTSIYTTTSTDNVGIGTTGPLSNLQIGSATFTGAYGSYNDTRPGLIVGEGAGESGLVSLQVSSTYNGATYPNYGLVLVNGASTADFDTWGIMHDGPAKATGGLQFAFAAEGTNIHVATPMVTFQKTGNVGIGSTVPGAKLEVAGNINSSTGALQTAGVTRIDNSGVGTFAAGTTIGGAAVAGETAGQIAFFATSCPAGWTEYTAARGMYIVGNPAAGTLATGVGTALTNLENRAVGQHNHTMNDPGHSHSARSTTGYGWLYSTIDAGTRGDNTPVGTGTTSSTTGISINNTGSVAGTNAPYIQLTACQKS